MKKIFVLIFVIFIIPLVGCTKTGTDDIEKIQNQFSGVFYAKVEYVTPSISSLRLDKTIEIKEDKLYMGDRVYQLDTQNFVDNFCRDHYSIKNDFKFPQTGLSATIGEDTFKYCYIFMKNKKNDLYMFEISQNNEENIIYIIASYKLEKRDE